MKEFCCSALLAVLMVSTVPAQAKDMSEFSVGDIGCYDRFGPSNAIGRVVQINTSKE